MSTSVRSKRCSYEEVIHSDLLDEKLSHKYPSRTGDSLAINTYFSGVYSPASKSAKNSYYEEMIHQDLRTINSREMATLRISSSTNELISSDKMSSSSDMEIESCKPSYSAMNFYEEVVHSDASQPNNATNVPAVQKTSLEKVMNRMAFWAMSLQQIHEEQSLESPSHTLAVARCLCAKANSIHQSIDQLQKMFAKASESINVEDVECAQMKVQSLLR